MPHHFRPYQPEQPLLLPPDLREWLPEDHLVYTVSELVDALDLAAFYAPYAQQGSGNLPYEPAMMVKILVYGYATGVLSSRRLAQKLEEDVAFRVLAAGNRPQHRTICEFRRRHRADFGTVLVAVVQLARDLGLVSLTTLVPDSTKVRAHASKRKAMSYGRMQQEETRLTAEIEALQAAAEALDTAEDAQFGMELRGDEVPVALQQRESRRAAIRAAQTALEARAQTAARPAPSVTPEPRSQSNFTDPESRIMPTSQDGFQQCYNAQLVVDADSQLIVTAAVSPQASDQGQWPRLLDAVQAHYGHTPIPCWPMPVTAMNGTCRSWKPGALTAMWRWGGKGVRRASAESPGTGYPAYADQTAHPPGPANPCPAQMAGGSTHRLDQAHPGLSPIRDARLAPGAGRVGPGGSGPERQALAPPLAELTRAAPSPHGPQATPTSCTPSNARVPGLCGPHAAQSQPSACLRPPSLVCTISATRTPRSPIGNPYLRLGQL